MVSYTIGLQSLKVQLGVAVVAKVSLNGLKFYAEAALVQAQTFQGKKGLLIATAKAVQLTLEFAVSLLETVISIT